MPACIDICELASIFILSNMDSKTEVEHISKKDDTPSIEKNSPVHSDGEIILPDEEYVVTLKTWVVVAVGLDIDIDLEMSLY